MDTDVSDFTLSDSSEDDLLEIPIEPKTRYENYLGKKAVITNNVPTTVYLYSLSFKIVLI